MSLKIFTFSKEGKLWTEIICQGLLNYHYTVNYPASKVKVKVMRLEETKRTQDEHFTFLN